MSLARTWMPFSWLITLDIQDATSCWSQLASATCNTPQKSLSFRFSLFSSKERQSQVSMSLPLPLSLLSHHKRHHKFSCIVCIFINTSGVSMNPGLRRLSTGLTRWIAHALEIRANYCRFVVEKYRAVMMFWSIFPVRVNTFLSKDETSTAQKIQKQKNNIFKRGTDVWPPWKR